MSLTVLDHPLVAARMGELRAAATPSARFRALVEELGLLLASDATRHLATRPIRVATPLAETAAVELAAAPLVVPVLRAGLGLLPAFTRLLPEAEVGFAGLARDEATLAARWYLDRIPGELDGRDVIVLDPMLATGGTLLAVLRLLAARGATAVTVVALLAAPEGVAAVETACGAGDPALTVRIVAAALDERLDRRGFIVPGLGDAGDRLFGGSSSVSSV